MRVVWYKERRETIATQQKHAFHENNIFPLFFKLLSEHSRKWATHPVEASRSPLVLHGPNVALVHEIKVFFDGQFHTHLKQINNFVKKTRVSILHIKHTKSFVFYDCLKMRLSILMDISLPN